VNISRSRILKAVASLILLCGWNKAIVTGVLVVDEVQLSDFSKPQYKDAWKENYCSRMTRTAELLHVTGPEEVL
jgi:hypothetical protein